MELNEELSPISLFKLISFLFWSGLYLWWAVDSNRSPEWCSRVVTLLHGTVASCVGIAQCGIKTLSSYSLTRLLQYLPEGSSHPVLPTGMTYLKHHIHCVMYLQTLPCFDSYSNVSELNIAIYYAIPMAKVTWGQYALMVWSWGYFAFDLLWCLLYWTKSYTMICHHISAIVAINFYLGKDYTGCTFACTIALLEVTNPLLQTRWFLRDQGYKNTILYYAVEIIYLSLFLILRVLLGTYLVCKILWSNTFCFYEKLISLSLYLVSMVFVYEIVGYVFHRYRNKIEEFRGFANEMEDI